MRWHDSEGLIDAELLEDMLPDRDADYYFCGPKPFMVGIYPQSAQMGRPGLAGSLRILWGRARSSEPASPRQQESSDLGT